MKGGEIMSTVRLTKKRTIKHLKSDRLFSIINVSLLFVIAVVTLWPFFDTLMTSISPTSDLMTNAKKIIRIPTYIDLSHFEYVLRNNQTIISFRVTISRTIIGTLCCLVITALTAYPLSKHKLPGRNALMAMFFFTMIFQAGMIPTFLAVKDYKLLDTFWALIVPEMLNVYYMIIMRTFFTSLPGELLEAAEIDGCSELKILTSVVLPLSTPVLASIGLFYAVWHWNTWFDSVLYITDRQLWPMQTLLREILLSSSVSELMQASILEGSTPPATSVQAATVMVNVIPIACVYPFLQKHFVKGMMIGSVKG